LSFRNLSAFSQTYDNSQKVEVIEKVDRDVREIDRRVDDLQVQNIQEFEDLENSVTVEARIQFVRTDVHRLYRRTILHNGLTGFLHHTILELDRQYIVGSCGSK
jgi:NADH/NAD ratio-sensing transcriptional regulator Rex